MQYLGTIDKAKDIINKDFVEKLLGDYQPLINESSKLPYSLISGVPTSLPASDVYSWAKSATKPTYTWSEITSKPTWIGSSKPSYSYSEITGAISTTELQNYLTQNSYLNVTSGDNRYLKLSGGTISGKFYKRTNGLNYITFESSNGSAYGHIGFNGANTPIYVPKEENAIYTLWHSGNFTPSNYLPLSGGEIITGVITLKAALYGESYISWKNPDNNEGGYFYGTSFNASKNYTWTRSLLNWNVDTGVINFIKTPTVNGDSVWHSGNDGSGSGLDADLLDGKQPSDLNVASADMLSKTWKEDPNYTVTSNSLKIISNTKGTAGNYATGYGSGLSVISDYVGWQLMSDGGDIENPYFRSLKDTGAWKPWRQLAFIDDNVASATKLENNDSYTAWGQTFFINGKPNNIYGTAYFPNGDLIYAKDEGGANQYILGFTSSLGLGYGSAGAGYDTYILGNNIHFRYSTSRITGFTLNSSGNVGIGTTNPSCKLEVNGITRLLSDLDVKGYLYTSGLVYLGANSDGIYLHATGINFHNSSNSWTASCVTFDGNGNMTALHNLLVNGGITMYSDKRKKTILNHVELSLKDIANAPLIEHYYNSDEKKTTHVGSIAQYWAEMNDWFCKLDNEGYYTMEIQNAALASAISIARELDRYETKTDKDIKKLKKRICELEEEVERLKAS